jgi:hypothetical protein
MDRLWRSKLSSIICSLRLTSLFFLVPHWVRNAARDSADIFAALLVSPTTLDLAFS